MKTIKFRAWAKDTRRMIYMPELKIRSAILNDKSIKLMQFQSQTQDLNNSEVITNSQHKPIQAHNLFSDGVADKTGCLAKPQSEAKISLELSDTEHPDLKVGIQSNGRKYSVRTNRKRFFYPSELNKFVDALETDNQRIDFDVLINTGARYNEARNIKKEDIDFERGTLTIKVAKIKAKKGQKFPDPRTFKLSSQFLSRLKEYTKDLNDSDTLPFLTNSALNLAVKKIAKRIGIKDFYMMSVHNIRKTHGQYLVALDVNIANICKRLGHDMNTFLGSYCSPDIFNIEDRKLIHEILGDLV